MEERRRDKAAQQSFGRWQRRVGFAPAVATRISDLPDPVISRLAELDREATLALYDLVLGVRGWGPGERFTYLEPKPKVEALDALVLDPRGALGFPQPALNRQPSTDSRAALAGPIARYQACGGQMGSVLRAIPS
ncbi:MAG: hypothetical protein HY794_02010 [Desulfarculus sp.]|nr:hypothetical protein [Desulfarculus sp.]